MKKILLLLFFISSAVNAQQRKVLVEVFTNSHCTVCPPTHAVLKNYSTTSSNAVNINYIFYHMAYPYPDDLLYQANMEESAGRNNYYGPFSATPVIFFDGSNQGRSTNEFPSRLDARVAVPSPLEINLTGTKAEGQITINAEVIRSGNISASDLVIHFVVTENVTYSGRNGVSPQDFVMRKMVTSSAGEVFSINTNETKGVSKIIPFRQEWIADSLSIIVFVQSTGTKEVYQSSLITFEELEFATGIDNKIPVPEEFMLYQNYPNPFNPVTSIQYTLGTPPSGQASQHNVILKIFDILGNEIAILVNEQQSPGKYEIKFDGSDFSSGVYYYTLGYGSYFESRKMILLK